MCMELQEDKQDMALAVGDIIMDTKTQTWMHERVMHSLIKAHSITGALGKMLKQSSPLQEPFQMC